MQRGIKWTRPVGNKWKIWRTIFLGKSIILENGKIPTFVLLCQNLALIFCTHVAIKKLNWKKYFYIIYFMVGWWGMMSLLKGTFLHQKIFHPNLATSPLSSENAGSPLLRWRGKGENYLTTWRRLDIKRSNYWQLTDLCHSLKSARDIGESTMDIPFIEVMPVGAGSSRLP